MFQNGEWPILEEEKDLEWQASDHKNREGLFSVLRSTKEKTIELYGVWNGDFSEPRAREEVLLKEFLDEDFYSKEQGFYMVRIH